MHELEPVVDALNGGDGYGAAYGLKLRQKHQIDQLSARNRGRGPVSVGAARSYDRAGEVLTARLRSYVDAWLATGRNLHKCFEQHPEMAKAITSRLKRERVGLLPGDAAPSMVAFAVQPARRRQRPIADAQRTADVLFIETVASAAGEMLNRCDRCGTYFYSARRNKRYCRRVCGSRLSAAKATTERRKREQREKLGSVRGAIAAWKLHPEGDWKTFVAKHAGVTPNWLAFRLRDRTISVPKAGRTS